MMSEWNGHGLFMGIFDGQNLRGKSAAWRPGPPGVGLVDEIHQLLKHFLNLRLDEDLEHVKLLIYFVQ